MKRAKMTATGCLLAGLALLLASGVTGQELPAAWNAGAANSDYNAIGEGSFVWSDFDAWPDGEAPFDAADLIVSLEQRMGVGTTVNVDETITVGHLTSRSANVDGLFVGEGKLIFDQFDSRLFSRAMVW